jgi:hypothetical protein
MSIKILKNMNNSKLHNTKGTQQYNVKRNEVLDWERHKNVAELKEILRPLPSL